MAFCIVFGTHTFNDQLKGYEGITAQCHNCGNWAAHCISTWEWFTVCWIPLIPLSTHKYKEVACPICNFRQDIKNRPDVQSQMNGGGGGGAPPQGGGGPPQGWGAGGGPPPQQGKPQAPVRYT